MIQTNAWPIKRANESATRYRRAKFSSRRAAAPPSANAAIRNHVSSAAATGMMILHERTMIRPASP